MATPNAYLLPYSCAAMSSIFLVLWVHLTQNIFFHFHLTLLLEVFNTFGYLYVYTFNSNILKSLSYVDDKS